MVGIETSNINSETKQSGVYLGPKCILFQIIAAVWKECACKPPNNSSVYEGRKQRAGNDGTKQAAQYDQ